MTTLANSFEGGTSGTTITTANSGGTSGSPFDAVSIGSGATLAFDNTHAAHGSLSCQVATGVSAATSLAEWTTSEGSQATIWCRAYLYFTANTVCRPFAARSSGALAATIGFNAAGKIQLIDGGNNVVITFTNAIPLNQWFRIEGFITGNASTGQISASLYDSKDSALATETETTTAAQNTTGVLSAYWFGQQATASNSGPYWMDDIGISSTGPLGPVVTASAPRGTSIVPALVASGVLS